MTETSETLAKLNQLLAEVVSSAEQGKSPAVQNLQSKLTKNVLISHPQQSGKTDIISLAVYEPGDADWDPHKHPRLKDGKFAPLHKGLFLLGKALTATYNNPDSSSNGVSVKLQPGQALYKVQGVATVPIIKTPGGKFLNGASSNVAFGPGPSKKIQNWEADGKLEKITDAPAVAVPAPSEEAAQKALDTPVKAGDHLSAAQVALLPVGSQITDGSGKTWTLKHAPVSQKSYWSDSTGSNSIGIWASNDATLSQLGDTKKGTPMESGAAIVQKAETNKERLSNLADAEPSAVPTDADIEAAPKGTKATLHYAGGDSITYTKLADGEGGNWQAKVSTVQSWSVKDALSVPNKKGGSFVLEYPDGTKKSLVPNAKTEAKPPTAPLAKGDAISSVYDLTSLPVGATVMSGWFGAYVKQQNGSWQLAFSTETLTPAQLMSQMDQLNAKAKKKKEPTVGYKVAGLPGEEPLPIVPKAPKVGDSTSPSQFDDLPVGAVVSTQNNVTSHVAEWTKQPDGQWSAMTSSGKSLVLSPDKLDSTHDWKIKSLPGETPETSAPKIGDKLTGDQMDALAPGHEISVDSDVHYTKQPDGKWKPEGSAAGVGYPPDAFKATSVTLVKKPTKPIQVGDEVKSVADLEALPGSSALVMNGQFYGKAASSGHWLYPDGTTHTSADLVINKTGPLIVHQVGPAQTVPEHAAGESEPGSAAPKHAGPPVMVGNKITSPDDVQLLEALLPGSEITSKGGAVATKQDGGKWLYPGTSAGFTSSALAAVAQPHDPFIVTKVAPPEPDLMTEDGLDFLPVGALIDVSGGSYAGTWKKTANAQFGAIFQQVDGDSQVSLGTGALLGSGAGTESIAKHTAPLPVKVGDAATPDVMDALNPGAKVTSGGMSTFVKQSDGLWHSANGGQVLEKGWPSSDFSDSWKVVDLGENQPPAKAVGDLITKTQMKDLPTGARVSLGPVMYQKTGQAGPYGTWAWVPKGDAHPTGTPVDISAGAETGWKLEATGSKTDMPMVGDMIDSSAKADMLPTGTKAEKSSMVVTKNADGTWTSDATGTVYPKIGVQFTVKSFPEQAVDTTPAPVPGKKNKLSAKDPNDHPDPNGDFTPIEGAHLMSQVITPDGFVHPGTKKPIPLAQGDLILQHKITPESFAIMGQDGSKKFQINKLGKQTKWSPHIPKSNYKVIYTASMDSEGYDPKADEPPDGAQYLKANVFTHPVSGTKFVIGADEKLMQHNFSPNSYLVESTDGTPLYQINVKGKKYKIGGNLKPSNYFELYNGKTHAIKGMQYLNLDAKPGMGLKELNDMVDGLGLHDTLTIGSDAYTKNATDWTGPDGQAMASHMVLNDAWEHAKAGTADMQSDYGVPLDPTKLADQLNDAPVGTTLTSIHAEFKITKTGADNYKFHWGDSNTDGLNANAVAITAQGMDLADKQALQIKTPEFVKPPSGVNQYGLPVWNTYAAGSTLSSPLATKLLQSAQEGSSLDLKDETGTHSWAVFHNGAWQISNNYSYLGTPDAVSSSALSLLMDDVPDHLKQNLQLNAVEPVKPAEGAQDHVEAMANVAEADTKTKIKQENAALKKLAAKFQPNQKFDSADELNAYINQAQDYYHDIPGDGYLSIYKAINGPDSAFNGSYYYQEDVVPNLYYNNEGELSGLEVPDKYSHEWAKPEVAEAIATVIANINQGKKDLAADLSSQDKSKLTSKVNKLTQMLKIARNAQALESGNLAPYTLDPNFKWGSNKTFQFDSSTSAAYLSQKADKLKFTKESASLGWDPFNGTSEQYYGWLKDHGEGGWTAYLNDSQLKKVALYKMKAPGNVYSQYDYSTLQKMANVAAFKVKVSEAMADANGEEFHPQQGVKDYVWPDAVSDGLISGGIYDTIKYALAHEDEAKDVPLDSWPSGTNLGLADQAIPDSAKKALLYAQQNSDGFKMAPVVNYLAKSGLWYDGKLTYDSQYGKFPVSPGMKVYSQPDYYGNELLYFVPKNHVTDQNAVPVYKVGNNQWLTTMFDPETSTNPPVYSAPYVITKADAQNDGVNFTDQQWNKLDALEGTVPPEELTGPQLKQLAKQLKGNPTKINDLGLKAQQLLLKYPDAQDLIIYKDKQGSYRVFKPTKADWGQWVDSKASGYDSSIDFLKGLNPAEVYEGSQLNGLSDDQLKQLADVAGDPVYDNDLNTTQLKTAAISALSKWTEERTHEAPAYEPQVGMAATLKAIPSMNVGGGRPKTFWIDDSGQMYMFKPDNKEKFRPDTEHAANTIGAMFGFTVPPTTVRTVNGNYGVLQTWLDASGNLESLGPDDLNEKQLTDILEGNPLDWAISNHDTHPGNFMLSGDGDHIKIDLGQAWKALGQDKLQVDWALPGNFGANWYDKFYKQVQSGQVDKEKLDRISKAVLRKANQISTQRDDPYREQLEFAFKNRTWYPKINGKQLSKADFIDLAMERKHSTFADFYDFYQGLYKKGGYTWPYEGPESFQSDKTDSDAHLRISPEFADQVSNNLIHGKSVFFAGPDVEDGHVFFYTTKGKDGSTTLRGETKFREAADTKLMAWIKEHGGTGVVAPTPPTVTVAETSNTPGSMSLPDTETNNDILIKFAKTVGAHASDGKYNAETTKAAYLARDKVKTQVAVLKAAVAADHLYVSKGDNADLPAFDSADQQAAWNNWASRWLTDFDMIDGHKSNGTAPAIGSANPANWSNYTPPPGIDTSGKPKPIEKLTTADGNEFIKYSDFNYVGPSGPIGEGQYKALSGAAQSTIVSLVGEPVEEKKPPLVKIGEKATPEQIAMAPEGSLFKIKSGWVYKKTSATTVTPLIDPNGDDYKGSNSAQIKKLNPNQGWTMVAPQVQKTVQESHAKVYNVVTEDSYTNPTTTEPHGTGVGVDKGRQSGQGGPMYAISSPDNPGVTLRYMPWSSTGNGVNLANRGQMQIEAKQWDGSDTQIDKTIDMIREMGLAMDPADEGSLERTYWEMMSGLLKGRKKNSQWQKVSAQLDKIGADDPDRLQKIKDAFATVWGKDTVDNADFMPHFSQLDPKAPEDTPLAGHPYWLRPDFDVAEARKIHGDDLEGLPSRDDSNLEYLMSGVFGSSEDKIRYTGSFNNTAYSSVGGSITDRNNGGSQYGMYREGQTISNGIYAEPNVLGRTSAYAVPGDNWGNVGKRLSHTPWDLNGLYHVGDSFNEFNVKYTTSLLDDVAVVQFSGSSDRAQMIQHFKDLGITDIRGLPIEERFVVGSDAARKTATKVWTLALASEGLQKKYPGDQVGSTREWEGRKYIKRANGMWVPAEVWKG